MTDRDNPVRRAARAARSKIEAQAEQLELALVKFKNERCEIDFSVDLGQETVWATQAQIAELFGIASNTVTEHVKNVFRDGELDEDSVTRKIRATAADGKSYSYLNYNLDVILAVGYRANSARAIKFRQWATNTLRAYIVDGYALNEERLRNDPHALRRLAAKIRALRNNEKTIYAAVRECFKISASDYDKDSPITRKFYAFLQDKFHYAVTEKTASEIIIDRADHRKRNMGLTAMKGREPALEDARIAKNYLDENELYLLHLLCEQFLLFAETKALRGQQLTMKQLYTKLDALLTTNEYPVFKEYKDFLKVKAIQHAQTELALYKRQLARAKTGSLPGR